MPLFLCKDCTTQTCLKSKKPCKDIERHLRKQGVYSQDWIRPEVSKERRKDGFGRFREVPFSMLADIESEKDRLLQDNEL